MKEPLDQWANISKSGNSTLCQRATMIAIAVDQSSRVAKSFVDSKRVAEHLVIDSAFRSKVASDRGRDRDKTATHPAFFAADCARQSSQSFSEICDHHFLNTKCIKLLSDNLLSCANELPNVRASQRFWNAWAKRLDSIWEEAIALDSNLVRFSPRESEVWRDYMYANMLIMLCRHSSVRVSRTAWEALEEKLLTWDEEKGET